MWGRPSAYPLSIRCLLCRPDSEEQLVALEEAAGCWSDEDHPEMQTAEDIDRWLADLRRPWDEHLAVVGVRDDAEGQIPAG